MKKTLLLITIIAATITAKANVDTTTIETDAGNYIIVSKIHETTQWGYECTKGNNHDTSHQLSIEDEKWGYDSVVKNEPVNGYRIPANIFQMKKKVWLPCGKVYYITKCRIHEYKIKPKARLQEVIDSLENL